MGKKTDCRKDCQISRHLRDVPPGKLLMIRHPLSGDGCLREFSDAELLTDTGLSAGTRLKTETYMLYPGIELSYNYFLGDRFASTTGTKTASSRSTTAAGDASAGR